MSVRVGRRVGPVWVSNGVLTAAIVLLPLTVLTLAIYAVFVLVKLNWVLLKMAARFVLLGSHEAMLMGRHQS